jgi:hypothetical protein
MARYSGVVGYVKTVETDPGVFEPQEIRKHFVGNILNTSARSLMETKVNEDITLTQRISIVADAFAFENFAYIRYIEYGGVKWKVNTVEIMRPRLILNIGGPYVEGE